MPASRDRSRREAARSWWKSLAPDRQDELKQRSFDAYAARYPERVELHRLVAAALADGSLVAEPCDRCGGPGSPVYDYEAMAVSAWRCFACRKAGS